METYESGILSLININKFTKWFDAEIGTEYDFNTVANDEHYVVFFDLTPKEVVKIREYEKNIKTEDKKPSPTDAWFSLDVFNMQMPSTLSDEMHKLDIVDRTTISSYVISYDPEYGDFTHTFKTSANISNIKSLVSFMKIHIDLGEIHTSDVYAVDKETMVGIDLMNFIQ